ncbi:MAG TPA: 2-iminoacetate synthase ThiH [Desulfobacteraceae bacterium]|nr:2-iminoacetate synthase ThiH [Desulfobacteraceae bacterium]
MSSFYEEYLKIDREENLGLTELMDESYAGAVLEKEEISYRDLLVLLSPAASKFLDPMAIRAKRLTDKHFGKNINLYIPIYLSNECTGSCVYCGFNRSGSIKRRTLTPDEIRVELAEIASQGFRHVLILTGDAPMRATVDYIAEAIKIAREFMPQVSLEIYPMDAGDYHRLVEAGATGLTIYQETYDRETYARVHPAGKKRDFIYRLGTPDRALQAGFRRVGIGALLGLHDWREEAAYVGMHEKYLMKRHWQADVSISFPRLRDSMSGFRPFVEVTDRDLVQMILALRIFLDRVGITISTRESTIFRDNMVGYGVTMMSAGSRTNPGGYALYEENNSGCQFEIEDSRSVPEVITMIRERGYYPVFKDWDGSFGGIER